MRVSSKTKRGLLWGLVCLGVLFFVKQFFLDVRHVSSASMAPTLLPGDLVFVDKLYGYLGEPARHDVVLFSRPDLGSPFLKRVVGLPGESLQIVDGDHFRDGRIQSKSAEEFLRQAVLLSDSARDPLDRDWAFRKEYVRGIEGGGAILESPSDLSSQAALMRKSPYLVASGAEASTRSISYAPQDAWLQVRLEVPAQGTLRVLLGEKGDRFFFEIAFRGSAALLSISRESVGAPVDLFRVEAPSIVAGQNCEMEFGNVDNRLFLRLDGEDLVPPIAYERNADHSQFEAHQLMLPPSPVNLTFQDGAIRLLRVRLLRDIDYAGIGSVGVDAPCFLGPGEYFLLGDNTKESEDSRSFGRVLRQEIYGKGLRVIFPLFRFGGF